MFCESCGSRIPDGAKFCTECGTRVPETAGTVSEIILPDIPDVILPDVPDVILPGAPVIPDISQSLSRDAEEAADVEELPAESAPAASWSTVSQNAASGEPVYRPASAARQTASFEHSPAAAAQSSSPWSIPGGMPAAPTAGYTAQTTAGKPLYKRWWFWLLVVLGVTTLVLLLFAALIVYSMRNTMPPIDDLPPAIEAIISETEGGTDIDQLPSILENTVDVPDVEDAFPLDADDKFIPMEILTAQIDNALTEMGLEHEVYADDEDWVFVDVWTDGLDELAEAAYDGDTASLAEWNALTENVRVMSGDFLADLLAGGQHSAVCVVSLLDDVDTELSLAVAIDGELILDLVSGLDEYGLLEE